MKALLNDQVIAEADKADLIYIEGNWYFPPSSVKAEMLTKSDTPYTCPWKGVCQYFDVHAGDTVSKDSAFSYPEPKPGAIAIVKKDFANYIAFWRDIQVSE
ncbi:MAG: hypothetical protein JWO47_73 [Candidatus Saccharibacteria bacterium]|nr:hypothetical protein [Candidatus Saccharibacteria bacterium]